MLMQKWDVYIETLAKAITSREHYQRTLGQIALEVRREGGSEALKGLVEDLKERHGLVLSPKTLHNYSWVEEKLAAYQIPDDVPYRLRQILAGVEEPAIWIDKIIAGATTQEIIEGIKGKSPVRLIECPHCHQMFEPHAKTPQA